MPQKYLDFAESAPQVRLSKQNARDERDTRSYVTITWRGATCMGDLHGDGRVRGRV